MKSSRMNEMTMMDSWLGTRRTIHKLRTTIANEHVARLIDFTLAGTAFVSLTLDNGVDASNVHKTRAKASAVIGAVVLARSLIDRGTELDEALAELEVAMHRVANLLTEMTTLPSAASPRC